MTDKRKHKTIKVDYLARVEGEGAMHLVINEDKVESVALKIFEPPRFFEGLLRGRKFTEAPDITARICGICPVAYQMSSVHAMENACGVEITGQIRELRRLLYCGEWISSHTLHATMLHAPDFLGYESAIHLAKDHPDTVEKALKLKKIGNDLMRLLGGREIHPINVKVGGFYKTPTTKEFQALVPDMEWGLEAAREILRWAATFDYPDFEQDYEFVSVCHSDEYPFNEGRICSNKGLDVTIAEFDDEISEEHVERSTALHSHLRDRDLYMVGPMARYALNYDRLTTEIQSDAKASGLSEVCRNPFQSILVRMIEVIYALTEALRIIQAYEKPEQPAVEVIPKAGVGYGCTEAPRGLLHHRYRINDEGDIEEARIIPPTSQNQRRIEADLYEMIPQFLHLPDEQLGWQCEQAIRNYDPCISCATHFLKLEVEQK